MPAAFTKRLPLLRLVLYVLILAGCGGVVGHELYYAIRSTSTTGTILVVGAPRSRLVGPPRNRIWADYEYFDSNQERHVGRAYAATFELAGTIPATAAPGDAVDVQYLAHDPKTSRLRPSPAGGICFGAVAALALAAFVGELAVRYRRRRRSRQDIHTDFQPLTPAP